jgi:hypothetical protein
MTGRGQVLKEGEPIATVLYSLRVQQESVEFSTFGGKSEVDGLKDIRGEITVLDGETNLTDASILALRKEDGTTWAFFAKSGDPVTRKYVVVHAGGEGLVPPRAAS